MKKKSDKTHKNNTVAPDNVKRRERTEEKLRQDEQRFRAFVENSSDIIAIINLEGIITYINPAVEKILGFKPEERIGAKGFELIHQDEIKLLADSFNALARDKNAPVMQGEMHLRHKDGSWRTVEAVGSNLVNNNVVEAVIVNYRDITERKKTQEILRHKEERFRALAEQSSDIIIFVNREGIVTYENPAVERSLGLKTEGRIGVSIFERIHPDDLKFASDAFNTFTRNTSSKDINSPVRQIRLRHQDGSWRTFETVGSKLLQDNIVESVIINLRDITERKRSEEALRQSEEKYRSILEDIQEGYFEVDLTGNLTFFNDTLCRVSGYSREELMGMNNRQYTEKEELKKVFQAYNKVYITGEPNREFGQQIIIKDGTKRYIEGSISLLKDSSGKPKGFKGILRDITERKNAESKSAATLEALRKSEESYTRLVDTIHDIILSTDLAGNILFVNDYALKLGGYSREEIASQNILKFISPEYHEKVIKNLTRIMERSLGSSEYSLITKDGRKILFEVNGDVLRNEDGTAFGIVIVCRDISERKLAEEKFRNIFMTSPNCIAITRRKDGLFIDVNKAYEDVVGWKRESVIGTTSTDPRYNFWVDPSARKLMVEDLKADRDILNREFEFWRSDGSVRKGIYSARSIKIADEECLIFILQDITERKQMEDKLRSDQQELHAIMDALPIGVSWADMQGKIKYINFKFQEIFGYTIEDIPNIDTWLLRAYPDPAYREHALSVIGLLIERQEQGKETDPADLIVFCKNGSVRHVLQTMLFTSNRILVIYYDITERKQKDEELRHTVDSLRKAFGTIIQVMVSAVEMRDPYTAGHQLRSADLARAIATEMGLPKKK